MHFDKFLKSRFLRFLLAGGVGGIISYILLYILTDWFGILYIISSLISQAVGNVINFFTQKFWTFENKDIKKASWQGPLFLIKAVVLSSMNTALLALLVEELAMSYLLAQLLIIPLVTALSFYFSKLIFKNKKSNEGPASD